MMRRLDFAMLIAGLAACQTAVGGTFKGDLYSLPEIDPDTGKEIVQKINAPDDPVLVTVKRLVRRGNQFESQDLPGLTNLSFTGGSFSITLPETTGVTQEIFEFYFARSNRDTRFDFTQVVRGVVITAGKTTTTDVVVPRPQPVASPPPIYPPCYIWGFDPALRDHAGLCRVRSHHRR